MPSLRDKFTNIRRSLRGKRHSKTASGAEGAYARADDDSDCHCSICDEAGKEWDELLDEVDELRVALDAKDMVLKGLERRVRKLEGIVEGLVEGTVKVKVEGKGGRE